jgi:hypothetical protein
MVKGSGWLPYAEERAEERFNPDDDQVWREEAFGERPVLGPWGDPFHGPDADEVGVDRNGVGGVYVYSVPGLGFGSDVTVVVRVDEPSR